MTSNRAGISAGFNGPPSIIMTRETFEALPVISRDEFEAPCGIWRKVLVGGRWCAIGPEWKLGEQIEFRAHPIEIRRCVIED